MENLTHTLTGLMLSRAGLNRLAPHATAILLIASNIPDGDIVTALGGSLDYLDAHRAHTHALLFAPLMALLSVLLVIPFTYRKTDWKRRWPGALAVALLGVLAHLVLDWTNVYGIRMLLPFSAEWLRLDTINIIDFWIWGILLMGVAAPALSRLVSSEIGARKSSGQGAAIAVLVLLGGYEFGRYLLHQRAVATLNSRIYQGSVPVRVAALPGAFNFLTWNGLVEGRGYYVVVPVNLLTEFDPGAGNIYYQADAPREIAAARSTEVFRRFLNFSQFPLWRVIPVDKPEGAVRVTVSDMRFGNPGSDGFIASAVLDSSLRVLSSQFEFGPVRPARRDSRD